MHSVMILVKGKTVYINLGEILKSGTLQIMNSQGTTVFQEKITDSHYEVISVDEPEGKYWIVIESEQMNIRKSFHLK